MVVVGLALLSAFVAPARANPPRVTVIGDSVMTSVLWYSTPMSILQQGIDLQMEVAVCRRLTGVSCPFDGGEAPTLTELVPTLGSSIGKIAVVEMGYNDFEPTFEQSVEQAIAALTDAGVTRILWLTLREARHPLVTMNQILEDESYRHPELTLVDWNTYSRSHPEWFQNDGIHLFPPGGVALATLVHNALVQVLKAPISPVLSPLPPARAGRPYDTQLLAYGGARPYHWKLVGGALPSGLRLEPDGWIAGTPQGATSAELEFRVTDARGRTANRRGLLVVAPGRARA